MLTKFRANFCVVLDKLLARNMLSVGYFSDKKGTSQIKIFWHTVLMDLSKAYDCIPHDLLILSLLVYISSEITSVIGNN